MVGLARHIFGASVVFHPARNDRHAQVRCSGSRYKMLHLKSFITVALLCLYSATTGHAAEIPAPQDILYPGTLTLSVDLTDLDRRLFMVRESVPVKAGPLTLLYPQWLPGTHGPNGPVNMYAFHIDVPAATDHVDLEFQFASPHTSEQGRSVATPEILGLQWNTVVLYPAGYYTSRAAFEDAAHHLDER